MIELVPKCKLLASGPSSLYFASDISRSKTDLTIYFIYAVGRSPCVTSPSLVKFNYCSWLLIVFPIAAGFTARSVASPHVKAPNYSRSHRPWADRRVICASAPPKNLQCCNTNANHRRYSNLTSHDLLYLPPTRSLPESYL